MPAKVRRIVVDSDVLIEVLRGDQVTAAALQRGLSGGPPLAITPVTVAEIMAGVRVDEEARVRLLLGSFACLRIDRAVGELAGHYVQGYGPSHGVELADALVAACTSAHGARLWTRNRRHYPMRELRFFAP